MAQGEGITTTTQQSCKLKRRTDKTNAPQTTQSIVPHAYLLYLSWTSPCSLKVQ